MADGVCLVVGAGDATGGAVAKRFAAGGYKVCITRRARNLEKLEGLAREIRESGGEAWAYGSDAREEGEVDGLVDRIEKDVGELEVVVFNIGANVRFGIRETTARVYKKVWEMGCFGGFLVGRAAARVMTPRGRGTIIFTGATASVRGGLGYAAFSGAKHGLRALSQSMARELGPEGVHVVHALIDGAIATEFIAERFPERYAKRGDGGVLEPEAIAQTYWDVHKQPRNAWTHELDLRPWMEDW